MELLMETKLNFLPLLLLMLVFSACGGENVSQTLAGSLQMARSLRAADLTALPKEIDTASLLRSLDELAELERAGSWFQGLAITESTIRENAGDYAGAVAAAYKELSWAYGRGLIQKQEIEQGLLNVLAAKNEDMIVAAVNAILAFSKGQWKEAADGLAFLFDEQTRGELDEPDGFGRWMLLVCTLELSVQENRRAATAYKSIRARYTQFPEYWYRGARAFSGAIAADFAENCINSSPQGPFAEECRKILASYTGLKIEDGLSIKTKREIEAIISQSVNSANPNVLDSLLPLISLPDNPYTVYAVGAMRALTSVPIFREYFNKKAASSSGRLAERLSYICRG
jgi:hypothetical protein